MLIYFILLTLTAACTANVGELAIESLDEGNLRFTVACGTGPEAPFFAVEKASGAQVYVVCVGAVLPIICGAMLCTGGKSQCVGGDVSGGGFPSVTRTATGSGNSSSRWIFTRSRLAITSDDVDLQNGTHVFITNVFSELQMSANNFSAALAVSLSEVKYTITISPFTGTPGFAYSLSGSGTSIFMTITTEVGKSAGLGFASGTNSYPDWALLCENTISDCIAVECTSQVSCTTATTALTTQTRNATSRVSVAERPTTGPSSLTITDGTQTKMIWIQRTEKLALVMNKAKGERASWSLFQTSPIISGQTSIAPTFGHSLTMPTFDTAAMSFSTHTGKYSAVGFGKSEQSFPDYVVVCEPVTQAQCNAYMCTSSSACSASTISGTSTNRSGNSITYTRPNASSEHTIASGVQNLMWHEGDATSTFTPSAANVQAVRWINFNTTLQFSGTPPTFGVTVENVGSNLKRLSITTSVGKYAGFGVSSAAFTSASFPSTVVICEPISLTECGIYTCSDAATCVVYTAAAMQMRLVEVQKAVITLPDSAFPTQAAGSSSITANTYWYEAAIPVAGLTLSPSLASSQTWTKWLASVAPLTTAPDFPIIFTTPSASTLGVSMTPGTGQTVMLGWRSSLLSTIAKDVVICAPSSVGKCLDVVCTSSTSCVTRPTTILTKNMAADTDASFRRGFTAGDVKLTSATHMWLAYNIAATPASTTALAATSVRGVNWKFYTSAIDTFTTSNSFSIIPTILSGIVALAYLL